MDTERIIGADIMMAFDECPPGQSDYQYAKNSLMLTQRWLDRCIKRFNETEPLYGYQQGTFEKATGVKLNWKYGPRREGDTEPICPTSVSSATIL